MTSYTREELDWIEAEWAYHLHGRSAFLSPEDFRVLQAWGDKGVLAQTLVKAMEVFFERREKRPRTRAFVAMSQMDRDIEKLQKLQESLRRAGPAVETSSHWNSVKEPLQSDRSARMAFEAWQQAKAQLPEADQPGYLDAFDGERKAFKALVARAESLMGDELRNAKILDLEARLVEAGIAKGSLVWKRAWEHHWALNICQHWGIEV